MRAELLVLRKWPAAWGLLLVVPAIAVLPYYVVTFVTYLTATPAQYATLGTPAQNLPSMLPSQFVIVALVPFSYGAAPFAVLGAVLAGGDWGRGTVATSLLAGSGRVRAGAGQALALAVALAASVLTTFAACAAASLLIRALEAGVVNPADGAIPATWVVVRGLGVGLLVALAYGMTGLALGTVCRSAAGAIAAVLLWTVLIEPSVFNLGQQAGGLALKIANVFPADSAATVTSLFGSPGGGAGSQMYLPDRPAAAAWTLAAYTAAFLAVTLVLLCRRDVAPRPDWRRLRWARLPRPAVPARPAPGPAPARPAPGPAPAPGGLRGVLASLRAELLVMCRRPAVWALVLATPASLLIGGYLTDFVYYRTAGTGIGLDVNAPQVLAAMLPGQYLTTALDTFGTDTYSYGPAVFFLLGALVAGTDWERGTIRTALLQGPGRLQTRIGQDLAVLAAAAASVALTFAVAAAVSSAAAAGLGVSAAPQAAGFPVPAHVAASVAGALILALACTAIGLALGTVLRGATRAAGAVLLWVVVVQPYLDQVSTQLHGVLLRLYEALPDASMNTVVNLYNSTIAAVPGTQIWPPGSDGIQVAPVLAFAVLAGYVLVFLAVPAVVTRRRSIT
jgi:ABC-2 type transport system permease protein